MITISGLVWDEWNRDHVARHNVSPGEVEEICHDNYEVIETFRKRFQIQGQTKKGRKLVIVLSPEDRELNVYGKGIYYPITAFDDDEEVNDL